VSNPALLEAILREALAHDGPVVVNALVNHSELSRPPHIEVAQARGFSLYALKNLMNGRCSELVELAKTYLLR
jgi:pyruvate dehydrogenase (quinone)